MKFFKVLFLFIVVLFAVAKFTVPDEKKFKTFAANHAVSDSLNYTTQLEAKSFYTAGHIYYSKKTGNVNVGNIPVSYAVPVRTASYIGIFGTFWKTN